MTGARKRWAALAAASMALSGLTAMAAVAPAAADVEVPTAGLVAEYAFDRTEGTSVPNTAPGSTFGDATVINLQAGDWTGDSLRMRGGAKTGNGDWVRLPDDLLSGKTSATVTAEVKPTAAILAQFHFLWNIGPDASATEYFFSALRCGGGRQPLVGIKSGGVEQLVQSPSCGITADTWVNVTSVIDGSAGTAKLYLDGVEVASGPVPYTPANVVNQNYNTIGRAPWPDPLFAGELSSFRVWDRALTPAEIEDVSVVDAAAHADEISAAVLDALPASFTTNRDGEFFLPQVPGAQWAVESGSGLTVAADNLSVTAEQPAAGEASRSTEITMTASPRGLQVTRTIPVTVLAEPEADTPYGYLLVHFMEAPSGYGEKIYLDLSQGDNPEYWEPLNGGEPILSSNAGTTGVRDPFLTYNPDTGTYYVIATDLRVFGGDNAGWGAWVNNYSTRMNIWESTDLVTWTDVRQIDVALDTEGNDVPSAQILGQMWAPEATWVPYYDNGDGTEGAFVVYWSSHYGGSQHTMWGATRDFTQVDWHYGGLFTDNGGHSTIDATLLQQELGDGTLRTYMVILDYTLSNSLVLQYTDEPQWWLADHSDWTTVQTAIGQARYGSVEGPAMFHDHSQDRAYLFVDDLPAPGYQPMISYDLDSGFDYLDSPKYYMRTNTKHGGVVSLTKAQYDTVRQADAAAVVASDLGEVTVEAGADETDVLDELPQADVTLHHPDSNGATTAQLPVEWDLSGADLNTVGSYQVSGVVQSLAANSASWTGPTGEGVWRAQDTAAVRPFRSPQALTVTATVSVTDEVTPCEAPEFTDVPETRPFAAEIAWLACSGVTTGYADGSFRPSLPVNRDAMAAFLYRFAGSPEWTPPAVSPFSDVLVSHQFYAEITWLADQQITTGYTDRTFRPSLPVNRDAMAAFLYRFDGSPEWTAPVVSPFSDVSPARGFYAEVTWLADQQITTGYDDGTFRPVGWVSRDAMAAFLYRYDHR